MTSAWPLASLDEVAAINPPKPKYLELSPTDMVGFIPMAAVDEVSGTIAVVEERPLGELRDKSYRTFASNDVIFAKITPCMENGKSAVVPALPNDHGFGSTEFHVIRPGSRVDAEYIWRFVRQRSYRAEAERHMTGSVGQLRVPVDFLRATEIPLPPMEEQRDITRLLGQADEHGDQAATHLGRARRILSDFRQVVLAAACAGRLTEEWRNTNDCESVLPALAEVRKRQRTSKLRRERVSAPDTDDLPDLPVTWRWARVGEVGSVQLGGTPSRKVSQYWGPSIPWVSSGEVANCRITETRETITDDGLENSNAKLYPVGTVLIAMIGEGKTRGQAAILDISAATNQNAAGIIPNRDLVDPEYLWRWALAQYEITRAVGRGGNQPALNGQKVKELMVPVPPLDEQQEIVRRVDALLTGSDQVQGQIEHAAKLLDRTGQAVLARAFHGELL